MSKTLHRNLKAKIASLQGPEWESSDEEENAAPVVETITGKGGISMDKNDKKTKTAGKKRSKDISKETNRGVSVIYIGHLPGEFEEKDLRTFLMQFGNVERIRVSRSVKTGQSRGYAFVKFSSAEDARIVADTMQGYFLGKRRLVCHMVPDAHKSLFYDTDTVIERRKLKKEVEHKQRERNLTNASKLKVITARLLRRERKLRSKLTDLGIDYDFPGYENEESNQESEEKGEKKRKKSKDESSMNEDAEEPKVQTPSKKKRKDSVDSVSSRSSQKRSDTPTPKGKARADSISSETSASKKKKRKDSVGSVTSVKKSKRKDSVGSETSVGSKAKKTVAGGSASKETPKKKGVLPPTPSTPTEEGISEKAIQSEKKQKKKKNKRRSAP